MRTPLPFIALVFVSGACDDVSLSRAKARIEASPTSVDFGEVADGVRVDRSLTVKNLGAAALNLTRVEILDDPRGAFSKDGLELDVLAAGGEATVVLRYAGGPARSFDNARLFLESTADNAPSLSVPLLGRGVLAEPDAGVEPADAFVAPDAAAPDAVPDAGPADTGLFPDAAPIDTGPAVDAGPASTTCATPSSVYARLDPNARQANIELSVDGLAAKTTTFNDTARATIGKRYGRWYFEARLVASSGAYTAVGVSGVASLEVEAGSSGYGCSYAAGGARTCAFGSYRSNRGGAGFAAGSVVQVAADLDQRRVYFGVDGRWLAGQDPVSGTGGLDLGYDPDCAAIFPAVTVSVGDEIVTNFGASPFAHAVPAGYEPGWFEDATCPPDRCGSSPVAPNSCTPVTDPAAITAAYPGSAPNTGQCSAGGAYSNYTNTLLAACYPEEVHVISVYEGDNDRITVDVGTTPLPIVLVLSAYRSTTWTLNVAANAQLARVITSGYEGQTVTGVPPSAVLEPLAWSSPIAAIAYGWEARSNGGGASFKDLAGQVRAYTQKMELSFQGCYRGASFAVPY